MKTILAPIDFSEISARVVAEASSLAHGCGGRVVIFHVFTEPVTYTSYEVLVQSAPGVFEAQEEGIKQRLAGFAQELHAADVAVETMHGAGEPVAQILELVQRLPADYIVLGSHGHSAIYDLLVGATAKAVLRKACCPVLIVPARTKKQLDRPTVETTAGHGGAATFGM